MQEELREREDLAARMEKLAAGRKELAAGSGEASRRRSSGCWMRRKKKDIC
jgi:hypothetical protein